MSISRRSFLQLGSATVAGAGFMQLGGLTDPAAGQGMARQLAQNDPVLHLMNRITWGVRPDELVHAKSIGYNAYLEEQLHPETLDNPTGAAIERRHALLSLDRAALYQLDNPYERPYRALVRGMLDRAIHSRHQLLERMVDFWADHFNVAVTEDSEIIESLIYQRDAIRQHALGKFSDMLFATAKSPAMLVYLDNFINSKEDPNENYARELMELHTLGVDGGHYTEQDVMEVARAFTGWTMHPKTRDGFWFNAEDHDMGAKQILGHSFPAGRGLEDGLHVLSILANHPATAQFLSHKLCVRFVSDNPPQALINSTAQVWMQTDGDIRSVMRHILTSNEFRQSVGQKFRRPLEFFIGAMRATGAEFSDPYTLYEVLDRLAQVPYGWIPPNGYPDVADAWMNSNNLLTRWNVSMYLTHFANSTNTEVRADLYSRIGQPQTVGQLVDALSTQVFGVPLPPEMSRAFVRYASDGGDADTPVSNSLLAQKLATLFGLMLASPQYQWR